MTDKTITGYAVLLAIGLVIFLAPGCAGDRTATTQTVPHKKSWGIYEMALATGNVRLIYSADREIGVSGHRLNGNGSTLLFAQKIDGQTDNATEICTVDISGQRFTRLTDNQFWDLYPVWSPDGTRIAFLSWRENNLDIYLMDRDGGNVRKFYDSGFHDADIDWAGDTIVFTSQFAIWKINDRGEGAVQVTQPPDRGQWGQANLPAGDYDPRLSPDGSKIVFERLEDTGQPHGGYNIFTINSDGTGETRLTQNGHAQGLAAWSHSGKNIVYNVAAIDGEGKSDIYMMNSDGSDIRNITPVNLPAAFLCHAPVFSPDDSSIYFIGQWWE